MSKRNELLYSQCYLREDVDTNVAFVVLCADFEAVGASAIPKRYTPGGVEYRFSHEHGSSHWLAMVEDARIKIFPYSHPDGDFVAVNLVPMDLTARDAHKISPLQRILARHGFEPCSDIDMYSRWHTGRPKE